MSTQTVSSWTPVIIKGGVFQKTFTFTDEDGNPIAYTDFEIIITPNVGSPFTWNVANGQISFVSTGVYSLFVTDTETTAYTWSSGRYRFSVTDPDSNPVPCLTEGIAFAKDC